MIFRKTALGQEELRRRSGAIGARERSVLILVNGQLGMEAIAAQVGMDVRAVLQRLLECALIERVGPAGPQAPAGPPPQAQQAQAQAAESAPDVAAAQRRALRVLGEVYGPEAALMAEDLLAARDVRAFGTALRQLEETLVMYQGKRHAAELIARITGHG